MISIKVLSLSHDTFPSIHIHQARAGGARGPGQVRGDDAVPGGEQRIVRGRGFLGQHVHGRAGDAAGVQGLGQGRLVHEGAAAGVEQEGRRFHQRQAAGIDQVGGLRRERAMEADDVAFAEEGVELDEANEGRGGAGGGIGGEHLHAEGRAQFTHRPANAAKAHDAEREPIQLDQREVPVTPIGAARPAAFADGLGVMAGVVGEFEEQGEGHLRDGFRPVGRHIGHRDAAGAGGGEVHDIGAGGQHADVFEPGQILDVAGGQLGLVGQQDVGVGGAARQFGRRGAVVNGAGAEGLEFVPAQVAGIQGEPIQDNDVHGRSAATRGRAVVSRKPSSLLLRVGWRSLRRALASIWRMRSRVTSYWRPTSSSVRGKPSFRP